MFSGCCDESRRKQVKQSVIVLYFQTPPQKIARGAIFRSENTGQKTNSASGKMTTDRFSGTFACKQIMNLGFIVCTGITISQYCFL